MVTAASMVALLKTRRTQCGYPELVGDVCETIQTPIHCDLGANSSLFAKRKGLYIITTEGTMPLVDDRIVKYVPLYPEMRIQTVVAWKRGQPFGRAAQAFIEFLKEELGEK